MLSRNPTSATRTGRVSAAALGVLLCASALTTPVAGADFANAFPGGFHDYFREARSSASAPPYVSFDDGVVRPADLTAGTTARALAAQYRPVAGSAPDPSVPVDESLPDLLARLRSAFGSDLGLSSDYARRGEREVLLRNSDAFVRARVRLTRGKEWHGFVYVDMGAADSALKWQGLAGVRSDYGLDLLGGWRHVTYHFSPGKGFDSLDFDGPFLGATLAW